MRERWFLDVLRRSVVLVSLCAVALLASAAGAALKKYKVTRQNLNESESVSPQANFNSVPSIGSVALIDDSGASPVLRKLVLASDLAGVTTNIPQLTNGFVFVSQKTSSGFDPGTGTGDTNTSITWGNLDGWTISGTFYCHSVPSFICDFAAGQDSQTTDPVFLSSNYDVGTWTFHGTGWTVNLGYIDRTSTGATGHGNLQAFLRGARVLDGTVPALPLLGIASYMPG